MFLPDVNVWLALTFDSHHHPSRREEVVRCPVWPNLFLLPNVATGVVAVVDKPNRVQAPCADAPRLMVVGWAIGEVGIEPSWYRGRSHDSAIALRVQRVKESPDFGER